MSEAKVSAPIYPDGYDHPDGVINTDEMWLHKDDIGDLDWIFMLGLLTIISDTIATWPMWGNSEGAVVLPEVGSVWIHKDEGFVWPVKSVDSANGWVTHLDGLGLSLARFLLYYRPATVTPTPTADHWRSLDDVKPGDVGQICWWRRKSWDDDQPTLLVAYDPNEHGLHRQGKGWLWQPVPEGVIPPPPTTHDGGQ